MKFNDAGLAPSFFNAKGREPYRGVALCEKISMLACDLHATIRFIILRQRL